MRSRIHLAPERVTVVMKEDEHPTITDRDVTEALAEAAKRKLMRHHVGEITVDIDGVTYVYRVHQLTHNQSLQIFSADNKDRP